MQKMARQPFSTDRQTEARGQTDGQNGRHSQADKQSDRQTVRLGMIYNLTSYVCLMSTVA